MSLMAAVTEENSPEDFEENTSLTLDPISSTDLGGTTMFCLVNCKPTGSDVVNKTCFLLNKLSDKKTVNALLEYTWKVKQCTTRVIGM